MKHRYLLLLVFPLALLLAIAGCEGPEGPAGPAGDKGDQGDKGDPYPQYTYLGDNANTCGHCHKGVVGEWTNTGHSATYQKLVDAGRQNELYCMKCHTTGFDSPISHGDTVLTERGPNPHGFDDYFPPQTAEDTLRMNSLKTVQCEACHGSMGPTIYNHQPILSFATNPELEGGTSMCAKCHTTHMTGWNESGHGTVLQHETHEEFAAHFGRSSCWACHTSEGFTYTNDPAYAGQTPETHSMIGCVACHDPHNATNPAQLRKLDDVTALNTLYTTATFTGRGTGQLCVQCHKDRRDGANIERQIDRGDARFGPHHSNQMDMYLGVGSYEIEGYVYDRGQDRAHTNAANFPNACVDCHMGTVTSHGGGHELNSHTFTPALETCQSCHRGATDFNIGGKVTEINNLLDQLLAAIGEPPDSLGLARLTREQRMAGYAYRFVTYEGSNGIHNYPYTKSLLTNAIQFLNDVGQVANIPDQNAGNLTAK